MGDTVLPTTTQLLGLVLETLFYGMYIVMFAVSMYYLVGSDTHKHGSSRQAPNKAIIIAGLLLFLAITAQWAVTVALTFQAFIGRANVPSGPLLYLADLSKPTTISLMSFYTVEITVSDFIIIYRLWVVWHRKWRIVALPICTFLGSTVCICALTYAMHMLAPTADFFESNCEPWVASAVALRLSTNIYCTALLSYKIWSTHRAVCDSANVDFKSKSSCRIIFILVESASLYTATMLVTAITYFVHSFAVLTTIYISAPIPGIAYCLVILRFALGGAFTQSGASHTPYSPPGRNCAGNSIPMDAIRIDITHERLSNNEANVFGKAEDGDSAHGSHVKACA